MTIVKGCTRAVAFTSDVSALHARCFRPEGLQHDARAEMMFRWGARWGDSLFAAEAEPALGNHDGVAGIVRVVLDGGGQAKAAGMEVHKLAEVGNLLRSLVGNAGHVVLVNEELGGTGAVHFIDINHGAIGDAADFAD